MALGIVQRHVATGAAWRNTENNRCAGSGDLCLGIGRDRRMDYAPPSRKALAAAARRLFYHWPRRADGDRPQHEPLTKRMNASRPNKLDIGVCPVPLQGMSFVAPPPESAGIDTSLLQSERSVSCNFRLCRKNRIRRNHRRRPGLSRGTKSLTRGSSLDLSAA
jgi:hypothetical protein